MKLPAPPFAVRLAWSLLLAGAVSCPGQAWAQVAAAGPTAVHAVDDAGHALTLAAPAGRIVSLAPHLTELLFAAGAGAAVVGVDAFSDYPAAARSLPRIGDSARLDLERIVALKPDLVVAWHGGNSAAQLQSLARLGLPVYASESRRLSDISSTLLRLGRLAGTETAATARAVRFDAAVAELRAQQAGKREVRVFYQIWHRPLLTVNGQHLIDETLRLCGGRNVFEGLAPLTPQVGEEAVLRADPEAIVAARSAAGGADPLAAWRRLTHLRAARLGNLLTVDPDTLHRQSERIVLGAAELCAGLDIVRARTPR